MLPQLAKVVDLMSIGKEQYLMQISSSLNLSLRGAIFIRLTMALMGFAAVGCKGNPVVEQEC